MYIWEKYQSEKYKLRIFFVVKSQPFKTWNIGKIEKRMIIKQNEWLQTNQDKIEMNYFSGHREEKFKLGFLSGRNFWTLPRWSRWSSCRARPAGDVWSRCGSSESRGSSFGSSGRDETTWRRPAFRTLAASCWWPEDREEEFGSSWRREPRLRCSPDENLKNWKKWS